MSAAERKRVIRMGFRRRTRRRALIAGAAIAHHRDNKYADQQAEYQDADQGQQQYAPPPDDQQQAPADDQAPAPTSGLAQQIDQLAQLHTSGALTDEEFAAAKSKALGS